MTNIVPGTKGNFVNFAIIAALITISIASCKHSSQGKKTEETILPNTETMITEREVIEAQEKWGEGIVRIGKIYLENGDYKTAASDHIDACYGYDLGAVLFKPTMAAQKQFRTDKEGALSYFVGGNQEYPEDHGFAIKPWSQVRWERAGIRIIGNMALAMGNYYFTPATGGDEVKVEFSFAYTRDDLGNIRIILHDSHLPYHP